MDFRQKRRSAGLRTVNMDLPFCVASAFSKDSVSLRLCAGFSFFACFSFTTLILYDI